MTSVMKKGMVLLLVLAMFLAVESTPTFAASAKPGVEDVEYKGKGVVEVEFYGKVKYKKAKVTLKDNKGKKYSARILKRDNDDIKFKINKYKTGRVYKITIKGVKKVGARKYAKVSTKVKIDNASQHITAEKAKTIALGNVGLKASQVYGLHVEKDYDDGRYVYEVEFNYGYYEYSYEIHATTGRILDREIDYDAEDYEWNKVPVTEAPAVEDTTQTAEPAPAPQGNSGGTISEGEAKNVALSYAGFKESDVVYIYVKRDYDDGFLVYDVEFQVGTIEYEYEVDARSGAILKFDAESIYD